MSIAPRIIMCARCNKPVERIEQHEFWVGTSRHLFRVRVFCHGEQEHEDFPVMVLELPGISVEFGRAFEPRTDRSLPAGK